MKALLIILALAATHVSAATIYQDRPFPVQGGALCFVTFNGSSVNASHIRDISVGPRSWTKHMGFPDGFVEQPPYMSLRITFITGTYFEIRTGDLKAQEAAFLKAIRECK